MMLRKVRNGVILAGVVACVGVGLYVLLLNDEAKKELKGAAQTIKGSYQQLSKVVDDMTGVIMEEDVNQLPNRKATIAQWEALGY